MNKIFICVIGPDNNGKSTVIKWLGATLCSSVESSAIISSSKYVNQKFVHDSVPHSVQSWKLFKQEDVGIILKVDSHTVGIFSPGDTEADVYNSIDEADKYSCDITIIAINMDGVFKGTDIPSEATSKVETAIKARFQKITGTIRIVNSLKRDVDLDWPPNIRLTRNGNARIRKDWKLHSLQTMDLMSVFLSTISNEKENN